MIGQAPRTPEAGVSHRQCGGVAESGFNRITGQEPGERRRAEYIAAAGGVKGFNGGSLDERRAGGRAVGRSAGPPRGLVALSPRAHHLSREAEDVPGGRRVESGGVPGGGGKSVQAAIFALPLLRHGLP